MELVSSRKVAIYLTGLQELRGNCDAKARAAMTPRPPNALFNQGPIVALPTSKEIAEITKTIQQLDELCVESGWEQAGMKARLVRIHIESNPNTCDWSSLSADLRNVWDMLVSDMWGAILVKVLPLYSDYVNSDVLIGDGFKTKFPSAVEDIREAGNCIAVDCGTAAVFHLMRGVEWGLRAFCVDLGVLDVPKKKATVPIEFAEWKEMLDALNSAVQKKIDTMPAGPLKQEAQEFYFSILHDIRGFKDAFRNHVMHTRKTYSQKSADDILDYVRRFFEMLGTRISE